MGDAAESSPIDPSSGFCKSNFVFYSKRAPLHLPPSPSLDVATFLSSQAHHGHDAFIDARTGYHLTYSRLWLAVESLASSLSQMGVRKGHLVLLLSPNSIFFPLACLAVMSLGAILTTANPLNTAPEIAKQAHDSNPVLAFTTRQLARKLATGGDMLFPVVLMDDEDGSETTMRGVRVVGSLREMIRKEPRGDRVKDRVDQDEPAALLYSSGTTGDSKGVKLTHRNLMAKIQSNVARLSSLQEAGDQRFVRAIPMFHIYGLTASLGFLASGSTTIVLEKFDMNEVLSAIEKHRATYLPLLPPILVKMTKEADYIKAKYDVSSLQTVSSGGAPLGKDVTEGFVKKYPKVKLLQGYGLTESTAVGATTDTLEESRRYGTAGLLSPSMEAKIVDPVTCQALGVNQTGELWLKGPSIMKGYLRNKEATSYALDTEGWLRTGDLCYIDNEGFLFVVDRLKEMIKYKGYQVAPAELEALLLNHPEIVDSAVIPVPDKEVGQIPMAYVVRKDGSNLSESAITDFVAGQVAPFKKVRRVSFIKSIPKNTSGKILRKDLIKLAASKSE